MAAGAGAAATPTIGRNATPVQSRAAVTRETTLNITNVLPLLRPERNALDASIAVGGIVRIDVDDIVAGFLELDLTRERVLLAGIRERNGGGALAAALDDRSHLDLVSVPDPARFGRTAAHHGHFDLERNRPHGPSKLDLTRNVVDQADSESAQLQHPAIAAVHGLARHDPLRGGDGHRRLSGI